MDSNRIMVTKLLLLLIVQFIVYPSCGQAGRKIFFRKDYTFLNSTDSFYKIHTLKKTWTEARRWCELEGATLFYPQDDAETKSVIEYWKLAQPRFSQVYIGISDLLAKGVYETIDGRSIVDVYSNWDAGEPNDTGGMEDCVTLSKDGLLSDDRCNNILPFICKKALVDIQWSQECDMPRTDYIYNANLGRCYKFHTDVQTWPDAFKVCSAELSYLAIIDSPAEAAYLVQLGMRHKKDHVPGNAKPAEALLGFHNRFGDGWRTVKGEKLEESDYAKWGDKNPDGGDKEQCGSMFFRHVRPQFDGQLNDLGCDERCFYICEHDIGAESIDERFNDQ